MTSPWITDAELAKIAARHDAIAQEPLDGDETQPTQEDE